MLKNYTLAFLLLLFSSNALSADTVELEDGLTFEGTVQSLEKCEVTMCSDSICRLVLDWSKVSAIQTDCPMKISMADGCSVEGVLHKDSSSKLLTVWVEEDESFDIPMDQICKLEALPDCPNEIKTKWSGKLKLNMDFSWGNDVESEYKPSFEFTRERGMADCRIDKLFLEGKFENKRVYDRKLKRRHTSENKGTIYGLYSRCISDQWGWRVSERIEYDDDRAIEHRSRTITAIEYDFPTSCDFCLKIFSGLGYTNSHYSSKKDDEDFISIPSGWEMSWPLYKKACLKNKMVITPAVDEVDYYIIDNDTSLCIPLADHWEIELKFEYDYNSKPPTGKKHSDRELFINLAYTF